MKPKNIVGLDDKVYRETKANAALLGITLGQYINEALHEKNKKETVKK